MCGAGNRAGVPPVEALPASTEWRGEVLPLEPVDELSVLTVCDNTIDLLLPDQGPARRLPMDRKAPMLPAPVLQEGQVPDAPLARILDQLPPGRKHDPGAPDANYGDVREAGRSKPDHRPGQGD